MFWELFFSFKTIELHSVACFRSFKTKTTGSEVPSLLSWDFTSITSVIFKLKPYPATVKLLFRFRSWVSIKIRLSFVYTQSKF